MTNEGQVMSLWKRFVVTLGIGRSGGLDAPKGRLRVVDKVDLELVVRLRMRGSSWREIAKLHPPVKSASSARVKPNVATIRRTFDRHGQS